MSILKRNYEISIWDDVLTDDGEFQEVRWGVIGSDKMLSQSRALKPVLGRNINGCQTFQFEMYRFYVDNITGERVENPFVEQLVSERKVKLKYKNKWHDFIIKDISENSSTHLYTYKLEDTFVQELSKNGFSVVLDESNNNSGTPKTLAERVLENTDWKVESEVFVQKVEDALIYLTIPGGTPVVHLLDQDKSKLSQGVTVDSKITSIGVEGDNSYYTILAFYSSCTNKPHRFQFIYLDDLTKITTDKEGKINNSDCQYYIEIEPNNYEVAKDADGNEILPFYLPSGFNLCSGNNTGGYIYNEARAERYSFTHQSVYIPKLDRYVKKYIKEGVEYYGYQDSEYFSPALVPNLIANTKFDSTIGWIPTKTNGDKPTVRNVYGRFENGKFIDSADEILAGTFNPDGYKNSTAEYEKYCAYLEVDGFGALLNSGIKDNRITLGNMDVRTQWCFDIVAFQENESGQPIQLNYQNFEVNIGEYKYEEDKYVIDRTSSFAVDNYNNNHIFTVTSNNYSEEDFQKNSQVYICFSPQNFQKYYIKSCQFYRYIKLNSTNHIRPDDYGLQTGWLTNNIVKTYYYYFSNDDLNSAKSIKDLKTEKLEYLSYNTYKPVYSEEASKIRSISVKESNYFNILQSIAETFGAWMEIDVEHEEDGRIKEELVSGVKKRKKYIRYKNYIGNNNYAGFRYGVNLKDIQRTFASKEIVTKLMVKPNSNKHAQNGFCAIGRANSNPTGEDYIYDFRYFHEKGLLNSLDYLNDVYVYNEGTPNYETTSGYYYKIKDLNEQIRDLDENQIQPKQKDLLQLESEYESAKYGLLSAEEGIKQVREDFKILTGLEIDNYGINNIKEVIIDSTNTYGEQSENKKGHISYMPQYGISENGDMEELFQIDVDPSSNNKVQVELNLNIENKSVSNLVGYQVFITFYPKIKLNDDTEIYKQFSVEKTIESVYDEKGNPISIDFSFSINEIINTIRSDNRNKIIEYTTLLSNKEIFQNQFNTLKIQIALIEEDISNLSNNLNNLKENKKSLNLAFFKKYSRFIQEGTWIDEKYHDDELYYADALSVMYTSCYPKTAYTINVLALGELEGYEGFQFELGDTTYVEDYEFFGDKKEEIVITEFIENLDDPSADQIKVQNFKNQFQDLFQKITATVQQAQYSTGSYEKAVALAEANQQRKQQFLTDALNGVDARLVAAGQQSVVLDNTGLTITDLDTPSNQIRMIGGAILLKTQDKNGQEKWTTGITSDGISANLITAGTINAGEIAIMNADEPVFRWDAFGISAFDFTTTEDEFGTTISEINPSKFVRFDKYGIYGIDGTADGMKWHASRIGQIDELSTFALTWEGLKVSRNSVTTIIGNHEYLDNNITKKSIIRVNNGEEDTFLVDDEGNVSMTGHIIANSGEIGGVAVDKVKDFVNSDVDNSFSWKFSPQKGMFMWNGNQGTITDSNPTGDAVFAIYKDTLTKENKLYINGEICAQSGNIGGWSVGNNYLITKDFDIGQENSFHMYSSGTQNSESKVAEVFSNAWRLTIGENFGINKYGSLYCNSGTVGSFNITKYSLCSYDNQLEILGKEEPLKPRIRLGKNVEECDVEYKAQQDMYGTYIETIPYGTEWFWMPIEPDIYNKIKYYNEEYTYYYIDSFGETIDGQMKVPMYPLTMSDGSYQVYKISKDKPNYIEVRLKWDNVKYNQSWGEYPDLIKLTVKINFILNDNFLSFCARDDGYVYAKTIESSNITCHSLTSGGFYFGGNQGNQMTCMITRPQDNVNVRLGISSSVDMLPFYLTNSTVADSFLWIDWFGKAWFNEVYCNSGQFSGSDRNIKNTITTISDKYEKLFDNLRSVTHKYNDGTSDRLHVGFIAQEVDQAIQIAGLSRQEFAGLGIRDQGTDKEWWGLRYSEFVPINTWQIQKLKPRMTAAEEKIQQLEQEVVELKQELAIFKNQ